MNATEIFAIMLLVRLVIPFGLVLGIGEAARRRHLVQAHRMGGPL
jgi:hypothetical protein